MSVVMWGEPGGEIRWQPQRPNGKRLWVEYSRLGTYKLGTYWATKPEWKHHPPALYRSYALATSEPG